MTGLMAALLILSALQAAYIFGLLPSTRTVQQETPLQNTTGIERVVRDALLQHEYEKVGGKDAYDTLTELQKLYLQHPDNPQNLAAQKAMIQEFKAAINGSSSGNTAVASGTTSSTTTSTTTKTLDEAAKSALLKDAVIEGNKSAPIVFLEYSDLECPYCIMQHNENKISQKIAEEFKDQVAYAFKNHRGVNHAGTEVKALGALCVNKLGGTEAYHKYYTAVLSGSQAGGAVYPVADLPKLVESFGVDKAKWQSCVDSKEFLAQFNAETKQGQDYGLRGTPGVLIFNQKTGKYTTIVGAQDYANFQSAVKTLIAE